MFTRPSKVPQSNFLGRVIFNIGKLLVIAIFTKLLVTQSECNKRPVFDCIKNIVFICYKKNPKREHPLEFKVNLPRK